MAKNLVEFKNVKTWFFTEEGTVKAVDGVSFTIREGQTLGLVGESGCGKSVAAMSLLRLIPNPPGKIVDGQILFQGQNVLELSDDAIRAIRGNEISVIFQEPMTSLNPVFTIGEQIGEVLVLHQNMVKAAAWQRAVDMLKLVGIPRAEEIVHCYPHELSGGMRQRAMIAMAIACNPKLLIADEPTTALDVTIQAQILDLMRGLKKQFNSSILLITHDLGVIAEMADYVVVMYCGKVVEAAPVRELFANPLHPYTIGLLQSKPAIHQDTQRLYSIPGQVPNPLNLPEDCHFAPRCAKACPHCKEEEPPTMMVDISHQVACWLYGEGKPE